MLGAGIATMAQAAKKFLNRQRKQMYSS